MIFFISKYIQSSAINPHSLHLLFNLTNLLIPASSPMTGVAKAVVYTILSVGMVHIKDPLLLIRKRNLVAAGFLSDYLSGPLPYV